MANSLTCVQFYTASLHPHPRIKTLDDFKSRLSQLIKRQHLDEKDQQDASNLIAAALKFASDIDIKILNTYLEILESSQDYSSLHIGFSTYDTPRRVNKSNSHRFRTDQFQFSKMQEYLFESPSIVSFMKQEDLKYLNFVLKETRAQKQQLELREVIRKANESWSHQKLSQFPELKSEFDAFISKGSPEYRGSRLRFDIEKWIQSSPSARIKKNREAAREIGWIMSKNYSDFDVLLMQRYLNLFFKFSNRNEITSLSSTSARASDWDFVASGLVSGHPSDFADFLFQSGHDMDLKTHVYRILKEMDSMESHQPGDSFSTIYNQARLNIESSIPETPTPKLYQTDMQIFSYNYDPSRTRASRFENFKVSWNSITGKLQSSVSQFGRFGALSRFAWQIPELKKQILNYFNLLVQNKTYTAAEAKIYARQELWADLSNATYITFTHPSDSNILGMARIFDGNRGKKTYIERKFKHIKLPERADGIPIFELGRVMTSSEVEANSLPLLMSRVAEHFENTRQDGVIYFDCSPIARRYYRRLGAQDAYSPEQTKSKNSSSSLWIMKMNVADFIQTFKKPNFEALHLQLNDKD